MLASQVFFLGIRCLPDVYLRLPARSRQPKHAGRRGIIRILLIFKGAHELKVRQIDYNIIFPVCRQAGKMIYSNHGYSMKLEVDKETKK